MAVTVYGADWCGDTKRTRKLLDKLGVAYNYVDVEGDPKASTWVKEHNGGKELKPTVDIDGRVLAVPADQELEGALRENGLIA